MMTRHTLKLSSAVLALLLTPALAGCESAPSDPFAAAQQAMADGEPRTALDLASAAIELDPDNPALRILAGDAAMALSNPDRAVSEYESVAEGSAQYALAQAKLAEAQIMGQYMQAARDTVAGLTMDSAEAFVATIAWHFSQGDTQQGFDTLDAGLAQFPDHPRLVTIDAERLWAQGKAEAAATRLAPVLVMEPSVPQAHMFAGQLALGSGDAKEARAHFEKVLAVRPMDQSAMLAMAAIARDRGDTQQAGNWINKANEAGPPHPIGLLFAAQMAYDAGEFARAFELIEMAPPTVSSDPQFARLRGFIDAARDQHATAAMALGDYVEATGGDPLARQVLANSLAELERFEEAWSAIAPVIDHPQIDGTGLVLALRLAEQTKRDDATRIRSLIERRDRAPSIAAEMREAGAAIRAGEWEEAERIYAPLIDGKGRTNPALLNNAAAVKTKLGKHEEAVALARRALAEAPDSPEIMDTLGWALWEQGSNVSEARALLTKAREGAPHNRTILEHWAIVHQQ